ncbi:MAG TPA: hypothetical protein VHY58_24660 [Streptosporangiaceae bacterium]|nr:hypothetical protein [Streptosporangiaceae bacterium]
MIPNPNPGPRDQRNEDACRQAAAQLQRDHGRWLVMWGCYTRRYVAFPLFQTPRGTVITAATPGELSAKMHSTERSAGMQVPPPRHPPQTRPGPPNQPGPRDRPGWR